MRGYIKTHFGDLTRYLSLIKAPRVRPSIDGGHTFNAGGQAIHNVNKATPSLTTANKLDYGR